MSEDVEHRERIRARITQLFPGDRVVGLEELGRDDAHSASRKASGYGRPVAITLEDAGGKRRKLVFHTARSDRFGHDRRSDRAQEMLLAFDTFATIPRHVRALDVGAIPERGALLPVGAGEFYLLTEFADGAPYADDLRRIAERGATALDEARCTALSAYLAELHAQRVDAPFVYLRALRDLVGSGEGLFGMVDAFATEAPEHAAALKQIEALALEWRWRLKGATSRLARIHGDFHPFNVIFEEGQPRFAVLDASRGSQGDPADDVCAMAINFPFFALDTDGAWGRGLSRLWHAFWEDYQRRTGDDGLLAVVAPFLAWRTLVVAHPLFYPALSAHSRAALLAFARRTLEAERFDPAFAEELFR